MSVEIEKLIKYALENDPSFAKKIALSMHRAHIESKLASEILNEAIELDLWEMESLVNSKKFDFPKEDIGLIGVDNDE